MYSPAKGYFVAVFDNITERKRAEAALRESEHCFRTTFENAAVGVAHVAADGAYVLVNRGLCEITGYSAAELCGKRFQDITHPHDLPAELAALQALPGANRQRRSGKRYLREEPHASLDQAHRQRRTQSGRRPRLFHLHLRGHH